MLSADSLVYTNYGLKRIDQININDKVLTHTGEFNVVSNVIKKKYKGDMIQLITYGWTKPTLIHPDCYLCVGDSSVIAKDIIQEKYDSYIPMLGKINNNNDIDFTNYCSNYKYDWYEQYIYAQPAGCKLTNDQIHDIRFVNLDSNYFIAKKLKMSDATIAGCRQYRDKPAGSVLWNVKLDYYFGLVIGWYAAEGSSSRYNIVFSMDGHINDTCDYYIDQLTKAIYTSIGIKTTVRRKSESNNCSVHIYSKIFKDIITKFCPGVCYEKYILPNILFSNKDFMRGFIVGYCNGDGHIRSNRAAMKSTSLQLISQVKLILSHFGIASSLTFENEKYAYIFGKRTKCRSNYTLGIHGINYDKFLLIFYPDRYKDFQTIYKSGRKTGRIRVDELLCGILHTSKNSYKCIYNDYIYSLAVEYDGTYVAPTLVVHGV